PHHFTKGWPKGYQWMWPCRKVAGPSRAPYQLTRTRGSSAFLLSTFTVVIASSSPTGRKRGRTAMPEQRREFRVTITGGREIKPLGNGFHLGKAAIDDAEPLRKKTIELLRDWLGRWGVLSQLEEERHIKDLPVHTTFDVLGEQLYQMI